MTEMRRGHDRAGGFTLAELMVSMGMAVTLMLVVVAVMGAGSDGFGQANRRVNANVEARAALTTMTDDVAGMLFDDNFVVKTGDGTWPSGELSFLALKPRGAQDGSKASGDLCFIHYYTAVTQPLEEERGPFSRKLYRRLVSSADVMDVLRSGGDFESPAADPARIEDEPVAFNVVQFEVMPKLLETGGEAKVWQEGDGQPDFIDVVLRVTDNATAGTLRAESDWDGSGPLAKRLLGDGSENDPGKRVQTFSVTIPMSAGLRAEVDGDDGNGEGGADG